ncbi:NPC1-like intracellular cholesterol transporter 1 [Uranotaenia lowii]|uniref:NPC1-like intracellular cholesterol transporter 1 n=1 Tax=Uranotaenia lowii TaxID=190385 RepID=UPI002478A229|nr:NPC1-like intracellular cholesterol transporter 1 [Uranotaenia lowii]
MSNALQVNVSAQSEVSENSTFSRDAKWLRDTFEEGQRLQQVLLKAPDILNPHIFDKALYILEQINLISVPHTDQLGPHNITWADVCLRVPEMGKFVQTAIAQTDVNGYTGSANASNDDSGDGPDNSNSEFLDGLICSFMTVIPRGCLISSPMNLWSNDAGEIRTLSREQILAAINDEQSVDILRKSGVHLVDLEKNRNTIGTEDWVTESVYLWEQGFLDRMKELCEQMGTESFEIFYSSSRSFEDIILETMHEGVGGAPFVCFMVFTYMVLVLSRFSWVEFRIILNVVAVMMILMAMAISTGIFCAFGGRLNAIHPTLPFLVLGLSIDDLFVMLRSLRKVKQNASGDLKLSQQIGLMLQHSGAAITVTSLTDIAALAVGFLSPFPGLRSFCILGAISVIATYFLALTLFVAALTLDERRISAARNGFFPWIVHDQSKTKLCCDPRLMERSMKWLFENVVLTTAGKVVILGSTLALTAWNGWAVTGIEAKSDPRWLLPNDGYLALYLGEFEEAFPLAGTETSLYFGEINLEDDFDALVTLCGKLENATDYVQRVKAWPKEFKSYVTKKQRATSLDFELKLQNSTKDYLRAKQAIEKLLAETPLTDNETFRTAWSEKFISLNIAQTIGDDTFRNIGLTLSAVLLCAFAVLRNVQLCFWIFVCVFITLVNVGGIMSMLEVTLNITSVLVIQIAIGFSIDYASHVAHTFQITVDPAGCSRQQRILSSVAHIGPAVMYGALTTLLSLAMTGFSDVYEYQQFAWVFLLLVTIGLFAGLVMLPVILSLVGPEPKSSPSDKRREGGGEDGVTTAEQKRRGIWNRAYQLE